MIQSSVSKSEPEPGERIIELEPVVQPGEISESFQLTEDRCCSCIACICMILFVGIIVVLTMGYTQRK